MTERPAINKGNTTACPHCGEPIKLQMKVELPPEQKMTVLIKHEHPLLSMRTVYGTLQAIEKTLRSTARDLGADCHVFLESVDCKPGSTAFNLFIADHDVKKSTKGRQAIEGAK